MICFNRKLAFGLLHWLGASKTLGPWSDYVRLWRLSEATTYVELDADVVQGSSLDTGHVWHDLELSVEGAATVWAEPVVVLLARVTRDGVRLWSTLGHFEILSWNDRVGRESSTTPLLTVLFLWASHIYLRYRRTHGAVAKSLDRWTTGEFVLDLIAHAGTLSRHRVFLSF